MHMLVDAPKVAPPPKEVKPKKKKAKADDPNNYGRGIIELYGYSGTLRTDWRTVYENLSPSKKLGVDAHVALLKIEKRIHRELIGRVPNTPEYTIEYLERYHQYEEAWKVEWGHIPGYWNWGSLPRKKKI